MGEVSKIVKTAMEKMVVNFNGAEADQDFIEWNPLTRKLKTWMAYRPSEDMPVLRDNLALYLVILYSYDSFLNQRNPIPLDERKEQAATYAGIEIEEKVEHVLFRLKNKGIVDMVLEFLIAQHDNMWTEIVTLEQQYEEAIRLRLAPVGSGSKAALGAMDLKRKLRDDCKVMLNDLEAYYKKFFLDHNDVRDKTKTRATSFETRAKSAKEL